LGGLFLEASFQQFLKRVSRVLLQMFFFGLFKLSDDILDPRTVSLSKDLLGIEDPQLLLV